MPKRRILVVAQDCNPDWPSLPVVGYKYARALGEVSDVTLATHVRNREAIERAGEMNGRVHYIDNEWLARPMYDLSVWLRRGTEVAWTVHHILSYLPSLVFERQILRLFQGGLRRGEFDIVHRITPMSPTQPSYIAGKTRQPFIMGPLNGNLDWPAQFSAEQTREREGLRAFRDLHRYLPYTGTSQRRSDCVLAGFRHTIDDLRAVDPSRIIPMPEIGIDRDVFHSGGRRPPFEGPGPYRFLYVGRLVPYKVPEVAVRAFVTSEAMTGNVLHIVGSGPELDRLKSIVAEAGAEGRVVFEGSKSQAEVAAFMRACDALVFPSIRELGAGVVIEAMACGMVCIVTDYGAPGALVNGDRGVSLPLKDVEGLVPSYRAALEGCLRHPALHADRAAQAAAYARSLFDWRRKAEYTAEIYEALLAGRALSGFTAYG
jgi:glycosyltransferase involved in cell wall biosynthesis